MDFIYRHPTIVVGGMLVGMMIFIAIFAPCLGTNDPTALAPGQTHARAVRRCTGSAPTCSGRDVYSRVMYGSRVSLIVGFSVALLRLGRWAPSSACVSGFIRGLDAVMMRVMDGLMSIPPILLAIALMALTRASVQNVIIAITHRRIPARLPPGARRGAVVCASSRMWRRRSPPARGCR